MTSRNMIETQDVRFLYNCLCKFMSKLFLCFSTPPVVKVVKCWWSQWRATAPKSLPFMMKVTVWYIVVGTSWFKYLTHMPCIQLKDWKRILQVPEEKTIPHIEWWIWNQSFQTLHWISLGSVFSMLASQLGDQRFSCYSSRTCWAITFYYGIQMDFFFAFLLASAAHCTPCGEGMVSF